MSDWHWHDWQGRSYLTCELLSPWPHGFFTQHWHPATPQDISQALFPEARAYRLKQVHGDRILMAQEISPMAANTERADDGPEFPAADGLVALRPQQAVWVATADCVPALVGDRRLGTVAAVHAGWRGTAQRIVPLAVSKLLQAGSQVADLRVALGPAIAGPVYQVSTAVAARVGATLIAPEDLPEAARRAVGAVSVAPPAAPSVVGGVEGGENTADADIGPVLAQLQAMPDSPLQPDATPGRMRLDVRRANQLQLQQMGLAPQQIAVAPYCTFADGGQFFSYRRARLKKVQWSGIVSQ